MNLYVFLHTHWDLYVVLYFAKHTWISMDSTDFFYFMDLYGLLLFNDYGFIPCDNCARISMDFYFVPN